MTQPEADSDALRAALAALQAHEQIRRCIYAYARGLDRLDRTLLGAQFWPDAEVDYGRIYRGPVTGFIEVALAFQGAMRDTQHLVGNVLIALETPHASVESYVQAAHVLTERGERTQLLVGARYLDRFERRGAEWRIAYRSEVIDWARKVPILEDWFELNEELPKGTRGSADPSYRLLPAGRASE